MRHSAWAVLLLLLAAGAVQADYEVPFVDGITIDGQSDDWGAKGLRVETLTSAAQVIAAAPGLDARLRLGWDERGLLVLVEVEDDIHVEAGDTLSLWSGDSVELFLSPQKGSMDIYQVAIAPGMDRENPELRHHVHDRRLSAAARQHNTPVQAARTLHGKGYLLEALVPLENLGIRPEPDTRMAFQIAVNDVDEPGRRRQVLWYPFPGAYADAAQMHWLHLSQEAGPPVQGIAVGKYEHFRRVRVQIAAREALAGQEVALRAGEDVLARQELAAISGQSAATLYLPMADTEDCYAGLRAFADGRYLSDVSLPSLAAGRRRAFRQVELRFQPFVFSQDPFPDFDFAQPSLVEDLIGPFTLSATFYDVDYNPVQTATAAGRYGAVVVIKAEDGQVHRRFLTLYRHPEPVDWYDTDLALQATLPPQLGIDPLVAQYQRQAVNDYFKWSLAAALEDDEDSAIFLAALFEAGADDPVDPWEKNDEWWYGLKRQTGHATLYEHLLYLPDDYDKDPERRWPLMVFLHGSGERGEVLDLVKMHGPPKSIEQGQDYPFIVASPQCPLGEGWLPAQVVDLVDSLSARYRVDPERIYLTGLSMGGSGTWNTATRYPHKFAAIAPICGGGNPSRVKRIARLPTWVFHGALDASVPLQESQVMIDSLEAAGGDVRFTVYPEAGHDSWTQTYDNPELYEWFLAQRRRQ